MFLTETAQEVIVLQLFEQERFHIQNVFGIIVVILPFIFNHFDVIVVKGLFGSVFESCKFISYVPSFIDWFVL